jgi:hypothetical protein
MTLIETSAVPVNKTKLGVGAADVDADRDLKHVVILSFLRGT